jgi:hypothetical protein
MWDVGAGKDRAKAMQRIERAGKIRFFGPFSMAI